MKVLGIANAETASACLVIDGIIVSAVSEERFSRKKMDSSFPLESIKYVLDDSKITLNDIDYVSYGWKEGFHEKKHLNMYVKRIIHEMKNNTEGVEILQERIDAEINQDKITKELFDNWIKRNSLESKVKYFNHHECHAISAFACSPFNESLVITSDARGDFESMQIGYFNKKGYDVLYRCSSFDSLGFFYGRITALLGYKAMRHEGKITGLAARGNPNGYMDLMKKMIDYKDGEIIATSGKYYRPFFSNFSEELIEIIKKAKKEDIAAAAQNHLENLIRKIVKHYLKIKPSKNVCMAGGVFANVRVNQKILEINGVENIFIQPHMGDGGLALGAAIGVPFGLNREKSKLNNMFLGPEFSDKDIEIALNKYKNISFVKKDDLVPSIVEAISLDKVVGLFQGRMEFGPRALCHRSIIYHCKDVKINDWLNKRLKRTEFMPFAPVTIEELAPKCYQGWKKDHIASKYMTVTYNCTPEMAKDCPATVHIDNTARPQVISKKDEKLMHRILTDWYRKTGGLSLINTSFNKHEEPIVCNPYDAIDGLLDHQVDVLAIGSYLVTKK